MDTSFHAEVLEVLPDAVIWVQPVYNIEGRIEDFKIQFSNKKANDLVGHRLGSICGLQLKRDGVPSEEMATVNFQHYLKVYESGEPSEFTFYAKNTATKVETLRSKFHDGVLSVMRDRAEQREAEQKEQKTGRILKSIVDNSPTGILVYEAVRNDTGVITDFRIKHYNVRSNELTGYSKEERENLSFRQILQGIKAEQYFSKYVEVVETNVSLQREQYIEKLEKWIISSVAKLDDGFLAMLTDITELKSLQHALEHQSSVSNGILHASLSGIYSLVAIRNPEGRIVDFNYVFANPIISKMLGLAAKDIVGKSMLSLIPENKTNGFFDLFCEVIENGNPVRNQTHFVTATFNNWFEYSIVRMDEDTLVVTIQDITDQKMAAIQIEQQKSMLDNIMKFSSSGISVSEMIRDEEGKVVDARTLLANDAAVKYTGIPKELYLSKTALELDPAIMTSPYYHMVMKTLETGEPFHTQYYLEPTGRWLETSVSKMDNDHTITIFTDVTETKKTQLQLEKYVEELKRTNANLEEFTYAASHDLKEPIRKISIFINQLQAKLITRLTEQEADLFNRIHTATTRMSQLVDDLLEYSHVSTKAEALEEINLNDKIRKVLEDLDLIIQEKGARITVGELPVIRGHRRQISQMFQNLISNALKYNKPGISPEITISSSIADRSDINEEAQLLSAARNFYRIDIKDNGIGFEQKYAQKIFQVFQRLHGKAEYQGTGVGLAIVKKVVQNHHGAIFVQSEPGLGSTFTVFLPVTPR